MGKTLWARHSGPLIRGAKSVEKTLIVAGGLPVHDRERSHKMAASSTRAPECRRSGSDAAAAEQACRSSALVLLLFEGVEGAVTHVGARGLS